MNERQMAEAKGKIKGLVEAVKKIQSIADKSEILPVITELYGLVGELTQSIIDEHDKIDAALDAELNKADAVLKAQLEAAKDVEFYSENGALRIKGCDHE